MSELEDATKGLKEQRDVNVRQVNNGYVVTGQRRWLNDEGIAQVSQALEAVAADVKEATALVASFLTNGTFEIKTPAK